ncbi:MAG: PEP-CTERM sorting domain-containing protein [Puniceicoccaceae bacterium]
MNNRTRILLGTCLLVGAIQLPAQVYTQGFEDPGWVPNTYPDWNEYSSTLTRVASGSITAASGGYYAQVGPGLIEGGTDSGAFTRLGGYSSTWPGGFTTSLDIFIDLTDAGVAAGTYGFDLSSAANGQDALHQRDFIFHVGALNDGNVWLGASNNSSFEINSGALTTQIMSSGWYTFQTDFTDVGGILSVDLSVFDSGGSTVFTTTRSSAEDIIATEVGGNRYMWFTYVDTVDGLAIDNAILTAVPEPSTYALLSFAALGLGLVIRRRLRSHKSD